MHRTIFWLMMLEQVWARLKQLKKRPSAAPPQSHVHSDTHARKEPMDGNLTLVFVTQGDPGIVSPGKTSHNLAEATKGDRIHRGLENQVYMYKRIHESVCMPISRGNKTEPDLPACPQQQCASSRENIWGFLTNPSTSSQPK